MYTTFEGMDLETYIKNGDIHGLSLVSPTVRSTTLIQMALMAKQIDVIYWICTQYKDKDPEGYSFSRFVDDNEMCTLAILYGDLESLRFIHEEHNHPLPIDSCDDAAWVNDLDKLKYLHERGCPLSIDTVLMTIDVIGDPTQILQYLYDHNCPWNEECTEKAAAYGGPILEFLHKHGCPWNEQVIKQAIHNRHMDILMYAYNHGCPYDVTKYNDIIMDLIHPK
jgi:hypothetical protein